MKLEWVEDNFQGRKDLNLMRDGYLVSWFRGYDKDTPLWWVRKGDYPDIPFEMSLEEAKAVVEAMIRLEG